MMETIKQVYELDKNTTVDGSARIKIKRGCFFTLPASIFEP
jgi:hypothetical protein